MTARFHAGRGAVGALFFICLLLLTGCDSGAAERRPEGPTPPPPAGFDAAAIEAMRAEKDQAFRGEESPIPVAQKETFPGLAYYPPNPAYAFRLKLEKFADPEVVKVAATGGDVRMMTRYGRFVFEAGGERCTLAVYKSDPGSAHLFVPFRDATNGDETYEVGRYLDLEEHAGSEPYLLDFNLSYNPYCAYNEEYTCPIVPEENVLGVAIRAGEKAPTFGAH